MNQKHDPLLWRILLVENDPANSRSVIQLFKPYAGITYQVDVFNDISAGLKSMSSICYEAVVLGLALSDVEKIQSLRQLRKENAIIPVIVLAEKDDAQIFKSFMDLDIDGCIPKSALSVGVLLPAVSIAVNKGRKKKVNTLEKTHHKDVIENLEDAYYETDLNGIYTYVNKMACRHFARKRSELIGASYKDLTPEHLVPKFRQEFNRVYKEGKNNKIINSQIKLPDGTLFYAELSVSLVRDNQGNITGFAGISRDVTEKKLAQLGLKKSEEKYRNILAGIEDGYFEVDLKGCIQFCNDSMCKMLGYEKEELMNMSNMDYMDKENAQKVYKAFNKIYRTGQSNLFLQYEIIRKDGTRAYQEVTVSLIRDKDSKPVGFRGISRDFTEEKIAQWALKESEEKYRSILSSIEDGYFEVDKKGKMLFFNDSMCRIYGYSREEFASTDYRQYMDKKNSKKVFYAFNHIFISGEPNLSVNYKIMKKNGERVYLESTVTLMKNNRGEVTGFRGIARDITERRNFIRELKKAKKGAEEASQAKSEFLANMSHEIRTPMNGVIGMYNLLLGTGLTAEQSDFVETGKRSADSLLVVINDILDFSKIEAGKLDIEVIDFDLRKSVEDIVALPAVQAHVKGLEFAYQIDHDVPALIKGDPGRLRQIIMNLSTNAIKFTEQGEVVFRVFLKKETKTHVTLHFSIQDTGIGISKKDQARLFSSFQQVDASTTRKYGGTGLGLAISKKLVELMGGSVHVDSILNQGSTFWFTSIFEKQPEVREKTFEMLDTVQGKRVLIVDDNQTNLDILSGYLDHWGVSCDQALGGKMALSLMRAVAKAGAPYEIVVSDMLMPEMDGAELGRVIKSDPALKDTLLIMLTSQGLRGDAGEMKRIGFSAYLNKPVRRSLLYDCLITVVNQTHRVLDEKKKIDLVTSYSMSEEKRHNLVLLLAEDNPVNQKLAIVLLKKFGFNPDSVNNGKEAVQAMESKKYDAVLMDIQMPEMDGLEATKIVRDLDSSVLNHEVLIIAMTAHAMKGDRDMCLKAGMDDYISKPIKPEKLLKVIENNIKDFK